MELLGDEEYFFEFGDIGVIDFSEGFDLAEVETLIPVVVLVLDFFDGDDFVGFVVDCLVDCTEGAVTQNFYYPILLHSLSNKQTAFEKSGYQ